MLVIIYLILPIKAINLKNFANIYSAYIVSEIIARLIVYIILEASKKLLLIYLFMFLYF